MPASRPLPTHPPIPITTTGSSYMTAATGVGFNFADTGWLKVENLKSDGGVHSGISLKLNNPMNGIVSLSAAIDVKKMAQGDVLYLRVTRNGSSLLNTGSGWAGFHPDRPDRRDSDPSPNHDDCPEGDILRLVRMWKRRERSTWPSPDMT